MKDFISKILLHVVLLLIFFIVFVFLYSVQMRNSLHFTPAKEILVMGDSHTQNGINDEILNNAINLSSSAESYFYTYVKLAYIIENNHNIESLVLAFSNHNFSSEIDSIWLQEPNNIFNKFGALFPFFKFQEVLYFMDFITFKDVFIALQGVLFQSIYSVERQIFMGELPYIGGFDGKTETAKNIVSEIVNKECTYSNYQIEYFVHIQKLCKQNDIDLILLSTPALTNSCSLDITSFINQDNIYLNWSKLELSTNYFADPTHLNSAGAALLSKKLGSYFEELR